MLSKISLSHFPSAFARRIQSSWFAAGVLALVCLASYGLLVLGAGYYGDDLTYAWLGYKSYRMSFFFEENRPILGLYFDLMTRWLGPAPWQWHVFALVWRWACSFAFWKLLDTLWPGRKAATLAAACLFSAYPGLQLGGEPMSMSPYYIQLAVLSGSMLATVRSLRPTQRRPLWIALALAGAFLNLLISEYFYFLELARLLVIWKELGGELRAWKRVRRTLALGAPTLALFGIFFIIRLFGAGNTTNKYSITLIRDFLADPFRAYQALLTRAAGDVWHVSLESFINALALPGLEARSVPVIAAFLTALAIIAALVFLLLNALQRADAPDDFTGETRFYSGWLLAGLGLLVVSGWPIWGAGLPETWDATASRFTLPFIPGACLLVTGLAGLVRLPKARWAILAVLVAGAVGFQVLVSYQFCQEKNNQVAFAWQMATRMPAVKPGTLFVLNDMPLKFNSENSNSALVNLIYTPGKGDLGVNYYVFQQNFRSREIMALLNDQRAEPERHGAGFFTRQAVIVATYRSPACFRILDPDLDGLLKPPSGKMNEQQLAAKLTDFSAISATPAGPTPRPPENIFGAQERPDDWCISFEQASLAAQLGQWDEVVRIGERAFGRGWMGKDPLELAVYAEGYAHQQQWARASDVLKSMLKAAPDNHAVLCRLKTRIQANTPLSKERERALEVLNCAPAQ